MRKSQSTAFPMLTKSQSHHSMIREINWDPYFSKMYSKNNEKVHRNYKEFFDKPVMYSQKGYLGSTRPVAMDVYRKHSPLGKQQKQIDEEFQREIFWETKRISSKGFLKTQYDNKKKKKESRWN